jgi:cytochrome c-type biogenesis protein CcmH/NrfG
VTDDNNREILIELRKLKRVFYIILVFVILGAVPVFYQGFTRGYTASDSWERVTTAMRRQDFAMALSMAKTLVERQPDYYYGHAYLGAIYLAMDDVTNAETEYLRAYQLFPNEENEKELVAIRKRMAGTGEFKLISNENRTLNRQ